MGSVTRQYIFGCILIGVAIYRLYLGIPLDAVLYGIAGLAFVVNGLTLEPRLIAYKKPLVILTWIFIASAAILFFLVVGKMF